MPKQREVVPKPYTLNPPSLYPSLTVSPREEKNIEFNIEFNVYIICINRMYLTPSERGPGDGGGVYKCTKWSPRRTKPDRPACRESECVCETSRRTCHFIEYKKEQKRERLLCSEVCKSLNPHQTQV